MPSAPPPCVPPSPPLLPSWRLRLGVKLDDRRGRIAHRQRHDQHDARTAGTGPADRRASRRHDPGRWRVRGQPGAPRLFRFRQLHRQGRFPPADRSHAGCWRRTRARHDHRGPHRRTWRPRVQPVARPEAAERWPSRSRCSARRRAAGGGQLGKERPVVEGHDESSWPRPPRRAEGSLRCRGSTRRAGPAAPAGWRHALLPVLLAGVFGAPALPAPRVRDDEARKAILDLRARIQASDDAAKARMASWCRQTQALDSCAAAWSS